MKFGYVKVGVYTPEINVCDTRFNAENIIKGIEQANGENVEVLVFPELSLTGCTCGDLYANEVLTNSAKEALISVVNSTLDKEMLVAVGLPIRYLTKILNVSAVICKGKILGMVAKESDLGLDDKKVFSRLEEEGEIDFNGEKVRIANKLIFENVVNRKMRIAVEIGSDYERIVPPSLQYANLGVNLVLNTAGIPAVSGGNEEILQTVKSLSKRGGLSYVFANAGVGESTGDFAYSGYSVVAENGETLAESRPFVTGLTTAEIDLDLAERFKQGRLKAKDSENIKVVEFSLNNDCDFTRKSNRYPFLPKGKDGVKDASEILEIQAEGLKKRILHTRAKTVILGLSGGLDSTLAILVAVEAFRKMGRGAKEIIAVTMPCFGTTSRTLENSIILAKALGVTLRKIDVSKSVKRHLKDIGHSGNEYDAAFENAQARERTQVLMDLANMNYGLVVGTGDLSELALGWATYNGDHMSSYGVNASVPKTLVRYLVQAYAEKSKGKLKTVLLDVLDTPVSPELIPTKEENSEQRTEDLVGPYSLHDFFLYNVIYMGLTPEKVYEMAKISFDNEYSAQTIEKWLNVFLRRFFSQQFKRSCLPDGVSVGKFSLSPRKGFSMPSDAVGKIWSKGV